MEQETHLSDEKIQEVVRSVVDNLKSYRRIPLATYRLQFNRHFKFSDARSIVSYLHELGISDIYVSPYLKARKGSLHGYDILNHDQLNPEIGTEEEYDRFVKELKTYGMGQVLDIVPNHMCIADDENIWWMDVLENNLSSAYADFFVIDWKPVKDALENKVLLPILGDQYGRVLENKELNLSFGEGGFFIRYYDRKLPVAPISCLKILKYRMEELQKQTGPDRPHLQELLSIVTALEHLPPRTEKDPEKIVERRREKEVIKKRLGTLYHESEEIRSFIDRNMEMFNGDVKDPRSFDRLDDLLNDQVYRLSHWRVAGEEINYRRFFDVNELAAIRMENPQVFQIAHRLIFKLIREGSVTGLRVDHPDGLYNPADYFYQLQRGCFIQFCLRVLPAVPETSEVEEKIGRSYGEEIARDPSSSLRMPLYVVGEKILTKGERMPEEWPIFSTTGYVFLNSVNGIFVDAGNAKACGDIYRRFIRTEVNYQDLIYQKKKVIACFPVYRTYVTGSGVNERDRRYIEQAVSKAKRKNPSMSTTVFDFLGNVLLLQYPDHFEDASKSEWLDFAMRFQQITGPVMAKGVEDTAFYAYHRFISLNEVGGNPERFGTSLDTFHGQNIDRFKFWPHAMITTSTHDTKRSEDVRARINVLSEVPGEWRECLVRWSRINKRKKSVIDGQSVPDRNEEYLIYQTLIGAWPTHSMNIVEYEIFKNRIRDYMLKAAREGKINTSWISPNIPHEEALLRFIDAILSPSRDNVFVEDFEAFHERVSYHGMFNSLSQTLLKITSPGIPDFYQGTEIWDFSLVDPDNREPVDFLLRKELLATLKKKMGGAGGDLKESARSLVEDWRDGSPKLFVTFKALNYRRQNPLLFREGAYIPLETRGSLKDHICAFARQREERLVLVIVPRYLARLLGRTHAMPLGEQVWGDSGIILPEENSGKLFRNIFTDEIVGKVGQDGEGLLYLGAVFANFPVAMLEQV
jgi:(1->4)-alpha-D-glucan 1-alpha-D-glucosylmutase